MTSLTPTTRRDFLRGKSMHDAAAGLVDRYDNVGWGSGDVRYPSSPCAERSLISVTRGAMACQFQIAIPATAQSAVAAASTALDTIEQLEAQLTIYDDSSEVSRINRFAAVEPVPVESRLFRLFETALDLTEQTEGAFDIAAGSLVKAWGFFRGPKRIPQANELAAALARTGSRHIFLDRTAGTIVLAQPGVEINLGAIGKGYALDRAAERLRDDWGITSALLHGGQSSVVAVGSLGEDGEAAGWHVAIGDPFRGGESIASVRLADCALGTSGTSIRFFEADGRRFGHILDPRTGWPACGHACVSVIAPTAATADALSTAFFILGAEKAERHCERHPEIGVILVTDVVESDAREVRLLGRARDIVELRTACRATN